MLRNRIAQVIFNQFTRFSSKTNGVEHKLLWKAYSELARLAPKDTLVRYDVYGRTIQLPVSSPLPSAMTRRPRPNENLQRLAAIVANTYPGSSMIDIGANIGDTALAMRWAADRPILCVEGSSYYSNLCEQNLQGIKGITVVNAFVDTETGTTAASIVENGGSGRAFFSEGSGAARTVSLAELASTYGYLNAKLVKIDCDGFDGRIIQGALPWIRETRPTLFWECELTGDAVVGGPGRRLFDLLSDAGYWYFAFYSNTGDYITTATADNPSLIDDLCWYLGLRLNRMQSPPAYADVCAIQKSDIEIFELLRKGEDKTRSVS